MSPTTLSKLFATLKNPTALASMASALPSVEDLKEYKPTDIEMILDSGHAFDDEYVKDPREYFIEDYLFSPESTLTTPSGIFEPDFPDNAYMDLTDGDLATRTENAKKMARTTPTYSEP